MAGHQVIELTEVIHEFSIATYQIPQTTALQMGPHWPMQQDVPTEKDSVSPIQKTNVIGRFTRRMNDLQVLAADTDSPTILKPMTYVKGRDREVARIKASRPWLSHEILGQDVPF